MGGLIDQIDPIAKAHWDAVRKTLRPASETLAHLKPYDREMAAPEEKARQCIEAIIHECLNGERDYGFPSSAAHTLASLEETARAQILNGPEGNEMVLRLTEAIRKLSRLMAPDEPDPHTRLNDFLATRPEIGAYVDSLRSSNPELVTAIAEHFIKYDDLTPSVMLVVRRLSGAPPLGEEAQIEWLRQLFPEFRPKQQEE